MVELVEGFGPLDALAVVHGDDCAEADKLRDTLARSTLGIKSCSRTSARPSVPMSGRAPSGSVACSSRRDLCPSKGESRHKSVVTAVFDGQVLRFDTPPDLDQCALSDHDPSGAGRHAGRRRLGCAERLAGTLDMPPDWASEHDHYLYGTPKRYLANAGGNEQ